MNSRQEKIKEQIRTIDSIFSDELLDLLYEYIQERIKEDIYNLPAFQDN